MSAPDKPEPPPIPGGHPVAAGVIEDMQKRVQFGLTKYGSMLHTHNGRDALMDAYQEALDLCMYLKQAIMERDNSAGAATVPDRFRAYAKHTRGCPFWYDDTEPGMHMYKFGAKCSCGLGEP